ncbi:MAG: P-II family nitrogen regulator [Gammaproteobacteria bacterium]|nr:P-II family nitrogen regulator [Gammaproteobacteria bacterium]MDH3767140.1 P-II family nitrogen regulator [Gammaproteobacteria bacterium]
MHFKLLVVFVDDEHTDAVIHAARNAGATGVTVVTNARGEGLKPNRTFFGLSLETERDVLLLLVEEKRSRHILETICEVGRFESAPGQGIAIQIDVEDAVGIAHQAQSLSENVGDEQ